MAIKPSSEAVPWYRNVKILAIVAQLIFVLILAIVTTLLVTNVIRGVNTLGVRTGFGFLGDRAGFPISESIIPYTDDNSYGRALIVGILNTLKVALIGIVLATILGVVVALMRLSANWVLRQIATIFIETVRNTPLVVQIFFFASVLLIPSLPSGVAALRLGPVYFNNSSGLIMPWPYISDYFPLWIGWLLASLVLGVITYVLRNRQLMRLERPGNPFLPALAVFAVVATVGYFIAMSQAQHPENLRAFIDTDRGRIITYLDTNANESYDSGTDVPMRKIPVRIEIDEVSLEVNPQRRTEQRQDLRSVFAFARLSAREFSEVRHEFENGDLNQRLSLHFYEFPSYGVVYEDRNNNGRFDAGEELQETSGEPFEGRDYRLVMIISEFNRRVVTDNRGETRFLTVSSATEPATTLLAASPLVMSYPYFPTERTQVAGGTILTIPYLALLLALTFYTASFIAEIVRGAILSVAQGQTEAAKALGLNGSQTFRLVVFPQAVRIITPPVISQYLNLTKNSSLGIFASYQEFYAVSSIVNNQSGAAMPIFMILIGGYLMISLTFSFILNWYNARMQLVER